MDRWTKLYSPLIGRIFLGGFFLWNGIEEILNFSGTQNIFLAINNLPYPTIFAILATAIEVLGGIMLIVGLKTRISATVLILYILVTSTLFFSSSTSLTTQLFLENMAVVGGLLYVTAYGAGSWSKD